MLHFVHKTKWLQKSCSIMNTQQKTVRNRELSTIVGRNLLARDSKFKIQHRRIPVKSSDCRTINQEAITHQRNKYSCGAHFHTILWRAKVCVFSEEWKKIHKTRPIWQVSSSPWTTDSSFTCYVSYILPNYSLMPQSQTTWLLTVTSKFMKIDAAHCKKTGENPERFKPSPWPQETDSVKKDYVYKELHSGKISLLYFPPRSDSDHFATGSYVFPQCTPDSQVPCL